MRNILQIIGAVLAGIATITIYIFNILSFKASKKDTLAENWMFAGFFFGSAVGIWIIVIFLLISLLFK